MPRLTNGLEQVFTNLGIVGDGYKLYFFQTGTTTPETTYTDENLNVANSNPVILDAAGRSQTGIWGSDPSLYRMVLGTPDSTVSDVLLNPIVDADPVDVVVVNSIAGLSPIPTAYWGTTAGTSTAYTLNPALVDITSYSNTQTFYVDFHVACGTSPTININALGSVNLKKYTGQGTKIALKADDVQPGRYECINDGTDIVVLFPRSLPIQSGSATSLTIASGVVAITNNSSTYAIDTESSAATDDLDTINGGNDGEIIYIRSNADARNVVIKNNTGNIFNPWGADITLDLTSDIAELRYSSALAKWIVATQHVRYDFLASKATNGYTYLPNGVIMQWGMATNVGPNTTTTITFPIAFPTANPVGFANPLTNNVGQNDGSFYNTSSLSQAIITNTDGANTNNISWLAIGY